MELDRIHPALSQSGILMEYSDRGFCLEAYRIMLVAITEFKPKVLVHCLLGIDRTPFVAMVYLSKKYNTSYKEAYELVKKRNPRTVFHWDWVEMLSSKCQHLFKPATPLIPEISESNRAAPG